MKKIDFEQVDRQRLDRIVKAALATAVGYQLEHGEAPDIVVASRWQWCKILRVAYIKHEAFRWRAAMMPLRNVALFLTSLTISAGPYRVQVSRKKKIKKC